MTKFILKGYDLSNGINNWTEEINGYSGYYLDLIWSNVTGTLDGTLLIRQTNNDKTYSSLETITISTEDKTHKVNNIDLKKDKLDIKFIPNGITGGRLSIKLRATEHVSLIGDFFTAATDKLVSLGSSVKRFKNLFLSHMLRVGGDTDFIQIKNGNLVFYGKTGLPYGYCYGDHLNWTQDNAAQNTWYPIGNGTDTDMISGLLNLTTHNAGLITVEKAGIYIVGFNISHEENAANVHMEFGVEVNGADPAVDSPHIHTTSKFPNQEQGNAAIPVPIALAAGETIQVSIRTIDTGTPNFKIDNVHLSCVQVGGM